MASQLEPTGSALSDVTPGLSPSPSLGYEHELSVGFELHKSSSTYSSSSSTSYSSSSSVCSSSSFEQNLSKKIKVPTKDASTQTVNSKPIYFDFFVCFYSLNFVQVVSREEKSLGIMSQKFLMLFLTSQVKL